MTQTTPAPSAHVIHADCLTALRDLPDASVDAVVTDPPYGLSNTTPAQVTETITRWVSGDREYLPSARGFMGHEWDGFVPPVAVWDECLRVLKPGGHLLAFAGSRTQDLMGIAVRLAGFEIRDSVAWLYGSGFPKSLDVSKAIDSTGGVSAADQARVLRDARERAGMTREEVAAVVGCTISSVRDWEEGRARAVGRATEFITPSPAYRSKLADVLGYTEDERVIVGVSSPTGAIWGNGAGRKEYAAPATDAAREWEGWGTALKPAMEPVTWARKPFSVVPLGSEATRLHHMIGALLWLSLSPAKRAELLSTSNHPAPHEATCVSALVNAGIARSLDESGETGTFSSPEVASTSWSIATSWNSILGALSGKTKTCTTSTRSSTTTALKTLCSLLAPLTSPNTMPPCACLTDGRPSDAMSAGESSSDEWARWMHTLSASAPESATEPIGRAVASALADIAASLSGDLEAGSSAAGGATPTTVENEPSGSIDHITLARKPLEGTVAANVQAHGTGALNIDACRIYATDDDRALMEARSHPNGTKAGSDGGGIAMQFDKPHGFKSHPSGRWPANVVLDESQAAELDRQSGNRPSRGGAAFSTGGYGFTVGLNRSDRREIGYGDSGGASRFFYVAKAPKSERPVVDGTAHPTVKPVTLMRWLVRMVTPPGGVVLDPFAGSGTTLEAAMLEGFNVIGIEREADYLPLIQHRIERATTALEVSP